MSRGLLRKSPGQNRFLGFHPCPIKGCVAKEVPHHRLLCIRHWHLVSEPLRKMIILLWNNGKPREGYQEARRNVIEQVERSLA